MMKDNSQGVSFVKPVTDYLKISVPHVYSRCNDLTIKHVRSIIGV